MAMAIHACNAFVGSSPLQNEFIRHDKQHGRRDGILRNTVENQVELLFAAYAIQFAVEELTYGVREGDHEALLLDLLPGVAVAAGD